MHPAVHWETQEATARLPLVMTRRGFPMFLVSSLTRPRQLLLESHTSFTRVFLLLAVPRGVRQRTPGLVLVPNGRLPLSGFAVSN